MSILVQKQRGRPDKLLGHYWPAPTRRKLDVRGGGRILVQQAAPVPAALRRAAYGLDALHIAETARGLTRGTLEA